MAFNVIYDNNIIMRADFYCYNMGTNNITGFFSSYDQMMQAAYGSNYSNVGTVKFNIIFIFGETPSNQDIEVIFKEASNNFTNYTQTLNGSQFTIACNSIYTSRNYNLQVIYNGSTSTVTKIRPNIGNKKIKTINIGNKPLKFGYIGNKMFYGEIITTNPPQTTHQLRIYVDNYNSNITYNSSIHINIDIGINNLSYDLSLNNTQTNEYIEISFTNSNLSFYVSIEIENVTYTSSDPGNHSWYIKCTDYPGIYAYGVPVSGSNNYHGTIGWSGGFTISTFKDIDINIIL